MSTIRVALLEMQPRLRDIVIDAVHREPDMQVVVSDDTAAVLTRVRPDALVCGAVDALDPRRPQTLLNILPTACVVMVADSGKLAALFELQPTRLVLHELSIDVLVNAIRDSVAVEDDTRSRQLMDRPARAGWRVKS